ncbi:merozoite surface protein CMZ-8-like [Hyalella azteca]|uniref:Merozoite surface protein CMZ-8-like n=1 Tax=Hyalella azteca TaxID=294128 RepID=A0A979FWU7_HYAAZ|nr:merozoite surface protein CMZ-8-like [Hyalella azteca]
MTRNNVKITSQPPHCPLTTPSQPPHNLFPTPSLPFHTLLTTPSQPPHNSLTTPSQPPHNPFTTPSQPSHNPLTTPSQPPHNLLTFSYKPDLDASDPNSNRPISNLSILSKLLERVVARQLNNYLHKSGLMSRLQSAYRRHHSTETAMLNVLSDIRTAATLWPWLY